MPEIKRNLRVIRAELGVNQKEFAEMINMPFSTYQKKESGESQFTLEEAYKISSMLNKSIDELFFAN